MKKHDFTKTVVTPFFLAVAIALSSCAHSPSNGWDGMKEDAASEGDSSSEADRSADSADVSNQSSADAGSASASDKASDQKDDQAALMPMGDQGTADAGGDKKGNDLGASEETKTEAAPSTDTAAATANPDTSASSNVAASADKPASDEVAQAGEAALSAPSPADSPAASTSPEQSTSSMTAEQTQADTSAPVAANEAVPAPSKKEPTLVAPHKATHLPNLPEQAVSKGNQTLNRYYFIKVGDTPKSVAQKLLGNADASKDLLAWNDGKAAWRPGHMILYPSPQSPNDAQILPFYADQGIKPESYQVKIGDSLCSIAKAKLGDCRLWTEIAVANRIAHPDQLKVGALIRLYPSEQAADTGSMDTQASQNEAAAVDTQASQEVWKPTTAIDKPSVPAPAAAKPAMPSAPTAHSSLSPGQTLAGLPGPRNGAGMPTQQAGNGAPPVMRETIGDRFANPQLGDPNGLPMPGQLTETAERPNMAQHGAKESKWASMEIVRFVQRNLFMVAMAVGAIGFLIYAWLLKRRQARAESDF